MGNPKDDEPTSPTDSAPQSDPKSSDNNNNARPTPARASSYTHVFPARPGRDKPATTSRSTDTIPKPSQSRPGPRTHFDFNQTNTFYSGLDFLLNATKDSERRKANASPSGSDILNKGGTRGPDERERKPSVPETAQGSKATAAKPTRKEDPASGSSKDGPNA